MSFPDDLQIKLIEHPGNALVLGGPGAGKTTTALLKAKSLIEKLQPFQKILFLSFSNSALAQIKTTLENLKLSFNKSEKQRIEILTYHSFCFDIILNYAFIAGVKSKVKLHPPEFLKCELAKRGIKEKSQEHLMYSSEIFREKGLIEFDMFAPVALEILTKSDNVCALIQSLFPYIILDEFQDTNIQQSEIVYKLASKSVIICLADREQMIYTYVSGVDEKRIDEAIETLKPEKIDFGTRNYRSKNLDILNFGNNILAKSPQTIPGKIDFNSYQFCNQVSSGMKSSILSIQKHLLKHENIIKPTIAILTRTNKCAIFVSNQLNATTGQMSFPIFHNLKKDENDLVFCNRILCRLLGITFQSTEDCTFQILSEFSDWYYMNSSTTSIEKGKKIAYWANQLKYSSTPKVNLIYDIVNLLAEIKKGVTGQIHHDAKMVITTSKKYKNEFLRRFSELCPSANHFYSNSKLSLDIVDSFAKNNSYCEILPKYETYINASRIIDIDFSFSNIDVMNMYKVKGREYDAVILFDGLYQNSLISERDRINPYDIRKVLRVAVTRAKHSALIYYYSGNYSILKEVFNIK
jgi:DNA helicase-2/ATP-dependent DNA helicase PcrA